MLHSLFENYIYNSNKRRIMSAVFIPDRRLLMFLLSSAGLFEGSVQGRTIRKVEFSGLITSESRLQFIKVQISIITTQCRS